MEIKPEWLMEVARHYFSKEDVQDNAKIQRQQRTTGVSQAASNAQRGEKYA